MNLNNNTLVSTPSRATNPKAFSYLVLLLLALSRPTLSGLIDSITKTDVPIDPKIETSLNEKFHHLPEVYNTIVEEIDTNMKGGHNLETMEKEKIEKTILNISQKLAKEGITDFHYGITQEEFSKMYKGTKLIEKKLSPCIEALNGLLLLLKPEVDQILEKQGLARYS